MVKGHYTIALSNSGIGADKFELATDSRWPYADARRRRRGHLPPSQYLHYNRGFLFYSKARHT